MLTDSVQTVEYDQATRLLAIPYSLAGSPPLELAETTLNRLVEASLYNVPLLDKHRHTIIDLFYRYGRGADDNRYEEIRGRLDTLRATEYNHTGLDALSGRTTTSFAPSPRPEPRLPPVGCRR